MGNSDPNEYPFYLKIYFTFFLKDVKFHYDSSKYENLIKEECSDSKNETGENSSQDETKKDELGYIHISEHWRDPPSVRRFLWGYFPHWHYNKKIEMSAKGELCQLIKKITEKDKNSDNITNSSDNENSKDNIDDNINIENVNLSISTVWGGASIAILRVEGKLDKGDYLNFIKKLRKCVSKIQDPTDKLAHRVNGFFINEIVNYVKFLNDKKNEENKIKWEEWFQKDKSEEYISGCVINENNECNYIGGKKIANIIKKSKKSKFDMFYQEPYVVVGIPLEMKDIDTNLEKIADVENKALNFFDMFPSHILKRKIYFKEENLKNTGESDAKKSYFSDDIERIRKGIEGIIIPKNIIFYFDPSRAIFFFDPNIEESNLKARKDEIHRALFVARLRMHFCILWEAKLQILSQKIDDILKELPKIDKEEKLFDKLQELNNLSLEVSAFSSELFNSFIWKYATFLPSRMNYLSTIYNTLDEVFNTSEKTKNIKNFLNEFRTQIDFASNYVREKLAERFYNM